MAVEINKKQRRIIIYGALVVLVGGLAAIAATLVSQLPSSPNSADTTNTSGTIAEAPAKKKSQEIDKIAYEGNLDASVQAYDEAIKNSSDPAEKQIYYSNKATTLYNNHQLDAAFDAAKSAYDTQQSSDSAAFVAQIAEERGDKATAIEYYKKAITLVDPSHPYADEDIAYYKSKVTGLGGAL